MKIKRGTKKVIFGIIILLIIFLIAIILISTNKVDITGNVIVISNVSQDYTFFVDAKINESVPSIIIRWNETYKEYHQNLNVIESNITIYRKYYEEENFDKSNPYAVISPYENNFTDTNVQVGKRYEYGFLNEGLNKAVRENYILAGINVPYDQFRGKILVIIDSSMKEPLKAEISQLEQDLISDGWETIFEYVERNDSVINVKNKISNYYLNGTNNLTSLYLLGHVPVPFSGCIDTDGHGNRAWPADIYYGVFDINWTDEEECWLHGVVGQEFDREENRNLPGDKKFDQGYINYSSLKLNIGRVDLYNLSNISKNETHLLKNYLIKSHDYKEGKIRLKKRVLINVDEGFKDYTFATSGYRLTNLVGLGNIDDITSWVMVQWDGNDYLFSYLTGPGSPNMIGGINYMTHYYIWVSYRTIFMATFGSYFGDWSYENNILRAPLASKNYTLTNVWSSSYPWTFHTMSLGLPIGDSVKKSICNDNYRWYGKKYYDCEINRALMGDPSIRIEYITPVTNITHQRINTTSIKISWINSTDNPLGYDIYRANNLTSRFIKLNSNLIKNNFYFDNLYDQKNYTYMVRAVNLTLSATGTYYNPSLGRFYELKLDNSPIIILDNPIDKKAIIKNNFLELSCNALDQTRILNISLNILNSQNAIIGTNTTQKPNQNSLNITYNYNFSIPGKYTWNCGAYDDESQLGISENRTIIVYNNTPPTVYHYSPINQTYNQYNINIRMSSLEESECYYNLNNQNNLTLSSTNQINFSRSLTLPRGSYNLELFCKDYLNNISEIRKINFEINSTSIQTPSQTSPGGPTGIDQGIREIQNITNLDYGYINNNFTTYYPENSNPLYPPENNNSALENPSSKLKTNIILIIIIIPIILIILIIMAIIIIIKNNKKIKENEQENQEMNHKLV